MPTLTLGRQKSLTDVLHDHALWHKIRDRVVERMQPIFLELYLAGSVGALAVLRRAGIKTKAAGPPEEFIRFIEDPQFAARAAQFVSIYTTDWWNRLEATSRTQLSEVLLRAIDQELSVTDISPMVAEIFGTSRADAIAVTETTRLFGAGAQATYQAVGVQAWEWRTANDGIVDEICDALAAGGPYEMSQPFEPAHVNCRCWPVPVES